MAAAKTDAVLVCDKQGRLCGILTDKDVAHRVVAGNLDIRTTTVVNVMTKNPISVDTKASANEALNRMVCAFFISKESLMMFNDSMYFILIFPRSTAISVIYPSYTITKKTISTTLSASSISQNVYTTPSKKWTKPTLAPNNSLTPFKTWDLLPIPPNLARLKNGRVF